MKGVPLCRLYHVAHRLRCLLRSNQKEQTERQGKSGYCRPQPEWLLILV
jgi:hypothetical protein